MIKQAYGEEALGYNAVFKWHRHFAQGRDSLEDEHTSWPRMVRTELKIREVATLVHANHSQMVGEIAAAAGINHSACHKTLSDDQNMSHITQHSVPCILTQDQRDDCISICSDLIDGTDKDGTFLNRIITGDETWCSLYDPQLKQQLATWKSPSSPRKKKLQQDRSKDKVMLELVLGSSGIVHMKFIPKGVTVNKHRYKEILHCLRRSVRRKHPELWRRKNWLLIHDNTLAHGFVLVQEVLAKQQVTVLPHPPYSSDLAPCDFLFFSPLERKLRGRQFQSAEEVVTATREAIWDLPADIFQQCFQQLYQRWQTCILANSDYFEDVDMCKCFEYLVIWHDKTTVHEIIDCSSVFSQGEL
jgi:histone-lysine N-methyltransferase SETMAR